MNTISGKGLAIVAVLALVYTAPAFSASSHQEQSHQQQGSEVHKSGVFSATSSVLEKNASKVNQEYVAKDERIFSWSDSSLGWVFGLALFGFVLMSNRNRV